MTAGWIRPDWPAPDNVQAFVTTRQGGCSLPPYDSLNLGTHVGDRIGAVRQNRSRVRQQLPDDVRLQWLEQVHGTDVVKVLAGTTRLKKKTADAAAVFNAGDGAVVMTADCLPVLFCGLDGSVAAAAHAGWRGLLDGVLEQTVAALGKKPQTLMAWMGPAIAPCHFQVGEEVRSAFLAHELSRSSASAFTSCAEEPGKWMMDIYKVARLRLQAAGLTQVYGGGLCTVCDSDRFFSYRRDGVTGRMASLIYLKP